MDGAQLQYARYGLDLMKTGVMKGAVLGPIDLYGKEIPGLQLDRCEMIGANFQKAFLISASFVDANLTGSDFYGANVRGANFANADLTNTRIKGATCLDQATFERANLSNSDWKGPGSENKQKGGGGRELVPRLRR